MALAALAALALRITVGNESRKKRKRKWAQVEVECFVDFSNQVPPWRDIRRTSALDEATLDHKRIRV